MKKIQFLGFNRWKQFGDPELRIIEFINIEFTSIKEGKIREWSFEVVVLNFGFSIWMNSKYTYVAGR